MKNTKLITILLCIVSFVCAAEEKNASGHSMSVSKAMAQEDRTEKDKKRDLKSHPEVTLNMLGIDEGDVVLDVFAGGGYYSELMARIVGEKGKVYLHNNKAYLNFVKNALSDRLKVINFPQLLVHDYEVDNMNFPENSADAAMIIMSYHDLFYDDSKSGWPQIDLNNFMGQIHKSLKSGGRFLIVDHDSIAGHGVDDAKSLHRIEKSYAIKSLEKLGFKFVKESDVLANASDDMTKSVFDPAIRGKTNRFVLLFEKK